MFPENTEELKVHILIVLFSSVAMHTNKCFGAEKPFTVSIYCCMQEKVEELKNMRQSTGFQAKPIPNFHHETKSPSNHTNKVCIFILILYVMHFLMIVT